MKLLLPLSVLFVVLSFCTGKVPQFLGGKKSTPTPIDITVNKNDSPTSDSKQLKSSDTKATPEKLDDDELISRLSKVKNQWMEAESKGDGEADEKLLADEFTNIDGQGKKYDKSEWIKVMSGGNPNLKSCTIRDENIESNTGDTAIMSNVVTYQYKNGATSKTRDIDKFVFRDGRWQVVSSQSTIVK